ncbi:MAG: hypothetical protein L6R41_002106 [Letrouitia leprolyta]|nr:MAG: hypothetical protein L6R41_002106 [Letrouitia leprolyta]
MTADPAIAKLDIVQGKPGPNAGTIITAVKILPAYGHFKWAESDGFKIGAHGSTRFQSWLDQAQRAGRLIRGVWKKRTWIGYAVLSCLVRAFIIRGIEHGTVNWDITIAKCLSVALVSSLGSRTGDVALSYEHKGKPYYLQYRHVELSIEGGEPIFANVRARITLEFEKGHKEELNQETLRHLRPLAGAHNSHMCPIAWILVHCLRHSLVAGKTLQEVLD